MPRGNRNDEVGKMSRASTAARRHAPKRKRSAAAWKTSRRLALFLLALIAAAGCAPRPAVTDAPGRPERVIKDILSMETADALVVLMKSDRPLSYTETRQERPPGIYLKFPDTGLDGMDTVYYPPPNSVLRSIRASEVGRAGEAHILLVLVQDAPYEMMPDPEGLRIVFRKPAAAADTGGMPDMSAAGAPARQPPAAPTAEMPPKTIGEGAAPAATVLREVRTEVRADTVIIRVTADGTVPTAHVFTLENPARIVFDLMGLRSVFQGEQRIPVGRPSVSRIRHHGHLDKVRLVVDTETRYLTSYFMEPTTDGLTITVGARNP